MPTTFRIASFNCENLFSRPKLINFDDVTVGAALLAKYSKLQTELNRANYNEGAILQLYGELKDYITVVETRGKLFNAAKTKVQPSGRAEWEGWVQLKRDKINDVARTNTAKVIKETKADIACLIEIEDRLLLSQFASEKLTGQSKYAHNMLIDGNDDRGIDVALLSKYPIRGLWSHIDDKDGNSRIFSRDCLEAQIEVAGVGDIFVLVNHLKSKGYGSQPTSDARRKRQAERIAEILQDYDLKKDLVVVAGDLNDTPDSAPLAPLLGVSNLYDVLEQTFPDPADRWTYNYRNKNQQIDYILVSKPLKDALQTADVYRRGIPDVDKITNGAIQPLPTVTGKTSAASDHGAVWAEFQL